jgi:hypothetical protein
MPKTKTRTSGETVYEKAERILSDPGRVVTEHDFGGDFWHGYVRGDHGVYEVVAASEACRDRLAPGRGRLACRCPAGDRRRLCAHALVGEEMRRRSEERESR